MIEPSEKRTEAEKLLYEAIVELEYVQNAPCGKALCASSHGKDIISRAIKLLKIKDLGSDELDGKVWE
jgi:hypothetical protein